MAYKYVGLEEEATYGTNAGGTPMYFKVLRESMETTREDFFPETTEYWTPDVKAEGFFRAGGDMELLIDPVQFPKLLVLFLGDPISSNISGSVWRHDFKFGANEAVSATGIKPFTYFKGLGIEKDRQFEGCYITSLSIEAINREVASCTASIVGNGNETLVTAETPSYAAYAQPYLTFASATTMTVGETDRLTTAPTIEAYRLTLTRGYDTDHYVLGKRYLSAQTPSGMATVEGSMDFSFTSEDEHERFLTAIGGTETGDQASFETTLRLSGATISDTEKYFVHFVTGETYFTASTAALTGRDRIVQACNFRANYHAANASACRIYVQNITTGASYVTLS